MGNTAGVAPDEITWATGRFRAAGFPEPRRLALRVWADLSGTAPGDALVRRSGGPGRPGLFRGAVERAAAGEPIPYVTETTGFRRLTLRADPRALIPRPETEGLVDLALAAGRIGRALDLGTGSGCIALALADEGAFDDVTGVDRSPEALALARENGFRLGLAVRWLAGDWCAPVRGERFDLIVANPPYIATGEVERLDASVRDWEPRAALDGGEDGLGASVAVLSQAGHHLTPAGRLLIEVDAARAEATARAARNAGWRSVRITDDLFGRPRFLSACRGA